MSVNSSFFTKFKKVISLVGSDREGERHSAADQVFRMCDENDLSILEAAEGAFGNDAGSDELRRQIEELEEDNRKLAEAVNVLNAQEHAISNNIGDQFLEKLWCYSQVRLVCALATIWGLLWILPHVVSFDRPDGFWHYAVIIFSMLLGAGTLYVVWEWVCAEFARGGAGVAVMKAIPMAICIYLCSSFHTEPGDLTDAGVVAMVTCLLCISNIFKWLAHELAHSDDEFFQRLRSWFA
jgi:hypothetical protein